jgi:tRNA A-37 threonylcarbamoyl transferase component Bud32
MATLLINPRYALHLWNQGLRTVADYLTYPGGVLVGSHATRNVTRVSWGPVQGFLKREFAVPWKEQAGNWWSGFGWVSKSHREWQILHELREHRLACPEPIAMGEDQGQAFVLVRALPEVVDLPTFLQRRPGHATRTAVLRNSARIVAQLHDLGFTHPDLYAKHFLIDVDHAGVTLIDFQRTRRRSLVTWPERYRDLAAFHASLGESLVSQLERRCWLRAYCRALATRAALPRWRAMLAAIENRASHLLRRRKLRAMRQVAVDLRQESVVTYQRICVMADPTSGEPVVARLPCREVAR